MTDYIWIHVHGGTIVSAYAFDSMDKAMAFRNKYDALDANDEPRDDVPPMPSGITDDPEGDTWILVEGERIAEVDDTPPHRP